MKDILLRDGDRYIECEFNDQELTFTFSDDPKFHQVLTLREDRSYSELRRCVQEICNNEGYDSVCDFFQTSERDDFFTDDPGYCYFDLRSRDELKEYLNEATDKVWLMRSCDIATGEVKHAASRAGAERIMRTYHDSPRLGYSDWECGYWNGVMGALRWVMGDEKDFLDT